LKSGFIAAGGRATYFLQEDQAMAQIRVSRIVVLGILLTASYGYAAEPRSSRVVAEATPQNRAALSASIPRRELELALRLRTDVLAEVKQRIQEMGLSASAEELTDLLEQRAHLDLGIEKCRLGSGVKAGGCRPAETELAAVEASFREKTGLSTSEFRSGVRDTPGRDAARAAQAGKPGKAGAQSLTKAYGDSCTCTFTVYSMDRWMNPYWGLECNNHASHGVCSNNVDSAHSAGSGSMTGDIDIYFGGYHGHRECPDDHYTCFRGPSTDNVGAWGNTCSCDTWHSQYYNPYVSWYGGSLTDSPAVDQLSTGYWTVAGACNENYVSVKEFIKENDPWCCDDPMGDLWVSLPLADGYNTTTGAASAQNCNGGSQSGVYPYCGTFGANIRVAYICSTYTPPPPPVCDPEAEQYCYSIGWNWDSWNCNCTDPCQPDPYCTEWNYQSCSCYRY
jgi:hypothetical protein